MNETEIKELIKTLKYHEKKYSFTIKGMEALLKLSKEAHSNVVILRKHLEGIE